MVTIVLSIALVGVAGEIGTAFADQADQAKARYTNATDVKHDCPVHWNYPKPGLPDEHWQAGPSTASKTVGVRYTAGDYALVLDYAKAPSGTPSDQLEGQFPWWGWISKSCLIDPVARRFPMGTPGTKDRRDAPDPDSFAQPLLTRQAVGGDNQTKDVEISPPHQGEPKKTIHFGSGGTLRSGPKQFATGNVAQGWEFRITRDSCRTQDGKPFKKDQWVFGYAPQAGRWGWVQAWHLPACTT